MGMVNQRTPDGSLTYNVIGYMTDPSTGRQIPRYEAVTSLSEDAQRLRDASNAANLNLSNLAVSQSGRLEGLLSKPMDMNSVPARADWSGVKPAEYGADLSGPQYQMLDGAPDYTRAQGGPTYARQTGDAGLTDSYDVGDSTRYEQALMERMNPQLDRSRQQLETNLANRGIKLGSAAYDRALDESNRASNDARIAAILNAGQEQSRVAGLNRDQATFSNNARQQSYANQTGQVGYNNQMTAQERADYLSTLDRNNSLESQGLQDRSAIAGFNNATRGQSFADQQAIQGRADNNANNRFSQVAQLLDAQDRQRSQGMQEQFALRNQPINEISALLSGSQVATPNFGIAQPDRMATTDVAGIAQNDFNNRQANYATRMQGLSDLYGGLFGLAGAGIKKWG